MTQTSPVLEVWVNKQGLIISIPHTEPLSRLNSREINKNPVACNSIWTYRKGRSEASNKKRNHRARLNYPAIYFALFLHAAIKMWLNIISVIISHYVNYEIAWLKYKIRENNFQRQPHSFFRWIIHFRDVIL